MRTMARLAVCLLLVTATLLLRPSPAESGGMTVSFEPVTWTEIDAEGREVTKTGVKAGLHLIVQFEGPSPANAAFPPSLMQKFEPVFERAAQILYDMTEGDVYIKTIEFTNARSRSPAADIVFRAYIDAQTWRAKALANGWTAKSDGSNVQFIIEQHICDQDNEAATFYALRSAVDELAGTLRNPDGSRRQITPADCALITDPVKRAECETGYYLADRCSCGDRSPFGIVHELGHYLFGLSDEYSGQLWNNCNNATAGCPKCPIAENCRDAVDKEKCEREELRVIVPTQGDRVINLAGGGAHIEPVELLRPVRDLVLTLDLDTAAFPAGKAPDMVSFRLLRPGVSVHLPCRADVRLPGCSVPHRHPLLE